MQVPHRIIRATAVIILSFLVFLLLDDASNLRFGDHLQLVQRISQSRTTRTKPATAYPPSQSLHNKNRGH